MGVSGHLESAVGLVITPLEKGAYNLSQDGTLLEIGELRDGRQVPDKLRRPAAVIIATVLDIRHMILIPRADR
jgi:hypothetical protein